jgi:hypothetical protein
MNAMMVIVMLELSQLSLQVAGSLEKCVVKIFSGNGSDQSFYKIRMRPTPCLDLGLTVERDRSFTGEYPLSVYARAALSQQGITETPQALAQAAWTISQMFSITKWGTRQFPRKRRHRGFVTRIHIKPCRYRNRDRAGRQAA